MGQIVSVHAREILDSRGNPTIEVDVMTAKWLLSEEQLCHQVHQPEKTKLLELRDGDTSHVILVKVF